MTWEKLPSPRKRSYPFNEPVRSSTTVDANSNVNTRAEGYNDPAAGYNMNRSSMADSVNAGGTNAIQRSLATPNYAAGSNVVQRSTSQITMNSNQIPTSIDSAEFKCGICNFRSTVYVQLELHLETKHSFEMFLSCVLCHKYFPNRHTFSIHRQLQHQDKDYFRCPHCGNGFGTEECLFHRQECKAQVSQPATSTSYDEPQATTVRSGAIQRFNEDASANIIDDEVRQVVASSLQTEIAKLRSGVALENVVTSTKDTVNIGMTSEVMRAEGYNDPAAGYNMNRSSIAENMKGMTL